MANGSNLNKLASELTLDERNTLLEKLRAQSAISEVPLYSEAEQGATVSFQEQYRKLPWYTRLYYFFVGMLRSKQPQRLFEDTQISKLGRRIEVQAPGVYDWQRNYLLYEFHRLFSDLRDGARFFYTALDQSVNRDRGEFYAFLGSLEMPEIHRQLSRDTNPETIAEANPDSSDPERRQVAFRTMEEAMNAINTEQRSRMYFDARSLACLKELSSFLFDRVLMAFDADGDQQVCSASVVRENLLMLNNILFSLKEPPPLTLLESLFVFTLQDRRVEPEFDMSREIRIMQSRAESAVAAIRSFNEFVPLTLILRCSGRDMSVAPATIPGGEEWFNVYREYWKHRIEARFAEYGRDRRYRDLMRSFNHFFKGTNLKMLGNVASEANPDGLPIPEAFALSFLLTFYSAVFIGELNQYLRPILIDGEFARRENRTIFTESYNNLIKLESEIKSLEAEISPAGDYGKRYAAAKNEMSPLPLKRRKIQIILDEASHEAREIINSVRSACGQLQELVGGIVKNSNDGLINLEKVAGKGTAQIAFVNGLADTLKSLHKTLELMKDIDAMENRR